MKTKFFILAASFVLAFSPLGAIAQDDDVDIIPPNEVKNVTASTDETSITLFWDETLDDTEEEVESYKIYYSTESILDNEGEYNQPVIQTEDNSLTYTVKVIEGETYYFTMTAIDMAGNESISFSKPEVEVTIGGEPDTTPTENEFDELIEDEDDEALDPFADENDTPTVLSAEANTSTSVAMNFSEAIVLPKDMPELAFSIANAFDQTEELEVISAEIDEEDPEKVILTTEDQSKGVTYTITVSADVTDIDDKPISSGITDSASFEGTDVIEEELEILEDNTMEDIFDEMDLEDLDEEIIEDTTPPENITNFLLSFEEVIDSFIIKMSWIPSINTAKDLFDQILYTSMNKGEKYDAGKSLGSKQSKYQLENMEGGKEYTFKITSKDVSGNENIGVIKSIRLPQTGPVTTSLFALSSLIAGGYVLRRKRKK